METYSEKMYDVQELISLMRPHSPADRDLVVKAYNFAKDAHKDHRRYSGEPYFVHLFETAKNLAKLGMGPRTICAGLLHDSIEDVGVEPETIEHEFGKEILFLIEGVTKLGKLRYHGLQRHTESLRKFFVATSQDIRVLIIKLADKLHNMQTLDYVPEHKRQRIALETLEIYCPLAHRLGIGKLKDELEDLAFKYVSPENYDHVSRLLKQRVSAQQKYIEKMHKSLGRALAEEGMRNFHIGERTKHVYSLYRKLQRRDMDIGKVYDIAALRVIVRSIEDCYRVLGIIHSNWRPLPGRIKDYIADPKPNGYRSIHTTVFTGDGGIVEIQIRTEEMHHEAEFGIASHLAYKEQDNQVYGNGNWLKNIFRLTGNGKSNLQKSRIYHGTIAQHYEADIPEWVKELAKEDSDEKPDEFMERLRTDFFRDRVFLFTPQGEVIDLPAGSCPIDFAYAIHSDIGDHASGAKVNGKLVALETELENGDIVEIQTKSTSKPTSKWLTFVKTSLARRHIKDRLSQLEGSMM